MGKIVHFRILYCTALSGYTKPFYQQNKWAVKHCTARLHFFGSYVATPPDQSEASIMI